MLNLLKNKLFLLIFFSLLLLVAIGVSSRNDSKVNKVDNVVSVVLAPIQNLFDTVGNWINSGSLYFKNIKAIKDENDTLKSKIDTLEKENRELGIYRQQNKELRDALNIKDQFKDYKFFGANITAKDAGNWFDIFVIDRGNKDGIANNMAVITSKGLVGKVLNADALSSKVISIIDPDSSVSARITKSRELVVVKGDITLRDEGLCRMDYIPVDVDIEIGDTVETSGIGGIYPKGILIGKIKEIRKTNSEVNRYAIIEPTVDFKRLEEVFVLVANNQ